MKSFELMFFDAPVKTATRPETPEDANRTIAEVFDASTQARNKQKEHEEAPRSSGISLPVSRAVAAEPAQAEPQMDSLTRDALQTKQEELNRREQDLKRLHQELDQKIERLQALEDRLQKMLKEAKDLKDKKMRHLVDVYSNMKAKQAAQVLETLDEKIAVKILAGMRGRQAGEILTNVQADKAARLSEALTKIQLPFE